MLNPYIKHRLKCTDLLPIVYNGLARAMNQTAIQCPPSWNGAFTKHTTAPFVFTGQRVTWERDIHRKKRKGVVDMIILQTKISVQDVGKCFNPEMEPLNACSRQLQDFTLIDKLCWWEKVWFY